MPMRNETIGRIIRSFSEEIAWAARETRRTGKEHGFNLCKSDDGIIVGNKCRGTDCDINLRKCRGRLSIIASVHTHPKMENRGIYPSPEDVLIAWEKDEKFFCILNERAITKCWRIMQKRTNVNAEISRPFYKFAREYLDGDKYEAQYMLLEDIILKKGKLVKQVVKFRARSSRTNPRASTSSPVRTTVAHPRQRAHQV